MTAPMLCPTCKVALQALSGIEGFLLLLFLAIAMWIHQGDDLESTTPIARRIAAALGVPFDPQLQRKSA